MADRQTTGGYPRLGDVITVDLPLLAQLRAGDSVRFALTTLEVAQSQYRRTEHELSRAQRARGPDAVAELLNTSGRSPGR